jgi:DNA-binding MurR/RpiR family transcriptional regulator
MNATRGSDGVGTLPRVGISAVGNGAFRHDGGTPGSAESAADGSAHKPTLSILIRVRGAMPSLRPAEQRVAQAVLADPGGISESSITTVARRCQTSETTVLRFCRAIGLAGYPELRIALARAAQWEETDQISGAPTTGQISATDSLGDVVAKITHADARSIEDTGAAVDLEVLGAAVKAVATAARIDIYGVGASGLVCEDLHQKLHRLGLLSFHWADAHLSLSSAAMLGPKDVAIGVSYTGSTVDTVDPLRIARMRGATTIAITNFGSAPIAEEADLLLVTAGRETTFRSGAMASRISQLALVDCLFAGVAQRSYDQAIKLLDSAYAVLQPRHTARPARAG